MTKNPQKSKNKTIQTMSFKRGERHHDDMREEKA
jgi:hypothetical protein